MGRPNILTDPLPASVEIGGAECAIRTDFRTSIRFEMLMRDKRVADDERLRRMLDLYYPELPADLNGAVERILWFYNCGREREKEEDERKRGRRRKDAVKYSFAQDGPYIYAAFREQYGVNLQTIRAEELHWWEFVAMFDSLRDDTKMGQIMYYRTVSTSGMPTARRRAVNEMKKLYALKDDASCDEKVSLAKRNARWLEYMRSRLVAEGMQV